MSSARTAATQSKAPTEKRRRALEYVKQGVDFWAVGARRKAWIQFTKAVETDPHCPEAYFEKGRVQQTLGNLSAAAKWYDRALEAAETPGRKGTQTVRDVVMGAHALRGIASWQSGSWETARREFHQAVVEGYEPSEFIRHLMGECELRLGRFKEALKEYEKIPWCEDGLMNYGLALFASGDMGNAVSTMRRAFFLTPGEVTALLDEPAEGGTDRAGEDMAEEAGQDEIVSGNEGANAAAYADRCGDLWEHTEGALPFLRTLWTDPPGPGGTEAGRADGEHPAGERALVFDLRAEAPSGPPPIAGSNSSIARSHCRPPQEAPLRVTLGTIEKLPA